MEHNEVKRRKHIGCKGNGVNSVPTDGRKWVNELKLNYILNTSINYMQQCNSYFQNFGQ